MPVVRPHHFATLLMLVLAFGSLSCGGESSPQGEGGAAGGGAGSGAGGQDLCPAPNRLLEDGSCLAPGVQDNGCPAGELGLEDGSCQPAGVPPELCAEGFEPLDQGCEPILPPDPCEPGLMAVPGDSACRDVAPCGSGAWGDIPVDGTTEYVDAAYAGGNSDGTADRPWTTIGEAITAAAPGALVAIAAGSYVENIVIAGKPVTLWGVCPADVEVVGSATQVAAVFIQTGADGAQMRSLAIRGDAAGLALSGSQGVVLDRLWVHDNASAGIIVQQTLGPSAIAISGTLIEQNHDQGVFVAGSDATIEGTVVRNTMPRASDQAYGWGINIQNHPNTAERASLTLRASLLEQNHDFGVLVFGSDAIIEGTVVRDTLPQASDQTDGWGISILHDSGTAERASLTLHASLLEQNHEVGVAVLGSDATIEGTVVRSTLPQASDQTSGRGINIQVDSNTAERGSLTLRTSLVEQNHQMGVLVFGSDPIIEGTVVGHTMLQTSDGLFGDGIVILSPSAPASALISSSLVGSNARAGVAVFGATASLAATVIECNVIELNQESAGDSAGTFDNQGNNRCGCGSEQTLCKAVSAGLEPPAPLGPSE